MKVLYENIDGNDIYLLLLLLLPFTGIVNHQELFLHMGLPGGSDDKKICLQCRRPGFDAWVRNIPWRRERLPTPVFLPGESHGQGSLEGYSPWSCRESDRTERLMLDHLIEEIRLHLCLL